MSLSSSAAAAAAAADDPDDPSVEGVQGDPSKSPSPSPSSSPCPSSSLGSRSPSPELLPFFAPYPPLDSLSLDCGCLLDPFEGLVPCEAWYRLECTTECKKCKETDRTHEIGFGSPHVRLGTRTDAHEDGNLQWEGILNQVELLPLMETLEKMDGQEYFDPSDQKLKVFKLDQAVPIRKGALFRTDATVRQVVGEYLKVEKWKPPQVQELKVKRDKAREKMGADAANNMAAIHVWTCADVQVFLKFSAHFLG
jgi:hypothetical protein